MAENPRRWLILGLGLSAQASACTFLYGLPFLVPDIRAAEGLSLAQVGVMVSAPTVGLLLTLIAWGAAADRYGERIVMALGLGAAGVLLAAGSLGTHGVTLLAVLLVAGAASASVNAASGRVVMGWFGPRERGLAMCIRQTAQPVGVGIAALTLPFLGQAFGYRAALLFPAGLCVLLAILVAALVQDPPRPPRKETERTRSPYLGSSALWRLHGASSLLVVPQFVISAFSLEYLVSVQHWTPGGAGVFLGVVQAAGAAGRIVTGRWADLVGSRLRPMRQLAVASTLVMLLLALGDRVAPWLAVAVIAIGAVITVADNGLGFTATAELAGTAWSGRALGAQNTAQNIAAALTPPLLGALVGGFGYATAFAVGAVFPLLAIITTPVKAEDTRRAATELAMRNKTL